MYLVRPLDAEEPRAACIKATVMLRVVGAREEAKIILLLFITANGQDILGAFIAELEKNCTWIHLFMKFFFFED